MTVEISRRALLLAAGLAWSGLANAGGVALLEIRSDAEVQQVVYEFSGDQVRIGLPEGSAEGYMVVTGGVPYMVMTGEIVMVLDLRQSMQMMSGMVDLPDSLGSVDNFHRLEATGRAETVAGIPGEIYRLTYTEDGQQKTEEVVLSDHASARELSKAMTSVTAVMAEAAGTSSAGEAHAAFEKALDGKGILRMGEQYRLASYRNESPGAERFRLPAKPTDLSGLQGIFGLMGGATPRAEGQGRQRPE